MGGYLAERVHREDIALASGAIGVLLILFTPKEQILLRSIGAFLAGLGLGAYLTMRPEWFAPRARKR